MKRIRGDYLTVAYNKQLEQIDYKQNPKYLITIYITKTENRKPDSSMSEMQVKLKYHHSDWIRQKCGTNFPDAVSPNFR